jgi:hypothetical protein
MEDLVRFQDRQHLKDPIKAKAKRRYVAGMREIKKFLTVKKITALLLAPGVDAMSLHFNPKRNYISIHFPTCVWIARVFVVQYIKTGKIYQMATKYTKVSKNITNGHIMYQHHM